MFYRNRKSLFVRFKIHTQYIYIVFRTVACPSGHFFDKSSLECFECERGFYQDQQAQGQCKPCVNGTSTRQKGARAASDCEGTTHFKLFHFVETYLVTLKQTKTMTDRDYTFLLLSNM